MGLAIEVGPLAWCLANGEVEGADWILRDLREINRLLAAEGLPPHVEPQTLPRLRDRCRLRGMPYSWIHFLRRAYAYAVNAPDAFTPLPHDSRATTDECLDREMSRGRSHLICHSDTEGYYVPIDFPEPLYDDRDELVGGMLGSSQGAMRELVRVAPLLDIRLRGGNLSDATAKVIADEDGGPLSVERQVWLQLYEAFRLSVEYSAVVQFC
jgi:hypothetical protein